MPSDSHVRGGEKGNSHDRDVQIVSWLLFVVALLGVGGHLVAKWIRTRKAKVWHVGWDDVVLATALLLALGQIKAVSVQANSALGRHLSVLNTHQVKSFQAAQYAATMLYILSLGTTRLSIWLFVGQTVQDRRQKQITIGMGVLAMLWTITSFLAAAFPCDLPHPWEFVGNQCYDRIAFARYIAASNIVLELSTIVGPIVVLWSRGKQSWTTLAFSSRFLCSLVAALIPEIYYAPSLSTSSNDFTYRTWVLTICIALTQSLALLTACLPSTLPHLFPAKPSPRIRHIQWDHTHPETVFPPPPYPTRPPLAKTSTNYGYVAPLATYNFTGFNSHKGGASASTSSLPSSTDDLNYESLSDFEDVFERRWNVPSIHVEEPGEHQASVGHIGVLPACEAWETDNDEERTGDEDGAELKRCRARVSGVSYVFERDKVISLPPITTPSWEGRGHEGFGFGV